MTTPNFATHRTASYSPEEAWEGAWFDQRDYYSDL